MTPFTLVLVGLAGLGTFISSPQSSQSRKLSDPFERYLEGIDTSRRDPSLGRFSVRCAVDIEKVRSNYAVTSGGGWQTVRNLRAGLRTLDSDFYTTLETWQEGNHTLIEMWPNSDDVGSEVRLLYCFANGDLQFAEAIQWNIPLEPSAKIKPWGYSRRWDRDSQGKLLQTNASFVDDYERVIPKPKLDADGEKSLRWSPPMGPLKSLKLPKSLLR